MASILLPGLARALYAHRYGADIDGQMPKTKLVGVKVVCIGDDDYRLIATAIKDKRPITISIALLVDDTMEASTLVEYMADAIRGLEATARLTEFECLTIYQSA